MVKKVIAILLFTVLLFGLITSCMKTDKGEMPTETESSFLFSITEEESDSETQVTTTEKEEISEIVTTAEVLTTQENPTTTTRKTITTTTTTTTITTTTTTNLFRSLTTERETASDIIYLYYDLEVPDVPDFKSWTNFRKSVNRNSGQWAILNSEGTWTDDNGFRRKGDDYMVAMGSYYTRSLGDRFKITTDKGNVFTVTICDWKNDAHTDAKHQYSVGTGCIVEFYVDNNLCSAVRTSGSASSISELSGKIIEIERIR